MHRKVFPKLQEFFFLSQQYSEHSIEKLLKLGIFYYNHFGYRAHEQDMTGKLSQFQNKIIQLIQYTDVPDDFFKTPIDDRAFKSL